MRNSFNTVLAGDAIAGYAFVVWHMNGTFSTSHWAARGPIGRSMVPAVVHDTLLKRIAVVEAKEHLEDEGKISK